MDIVYNKGKDPQDCRLKRGKRDRQRTRGHGFYEAEEDQHLCVQETKWKGSKARELENGFKLFYIGEDGRRNGVGIILNE